MKHHRKRRGKEKLNCTNFVVKLQQKIQREFFPNFSPFSFHFPFLACQLFRILIFSSISRVPLFPNSNLLKLNEFIWVFMFHIVLKDGSVL